MAREGAHRYPDVTNNRRFGLLQNDAPTKATCCGRKSGDVTTPSAQMLTPVTVVPYPIEYEHGRSKNCAEHDCYKRTIKEGKECLPNHSRSRSFSGYSIQRILDLRKLESQLGSRVRTGLPSLPNPDVSAYPILTHYPPCGRACS